MNANFRRFAAFDFIPFGGNGEQFAVTVAARDVGQHGRRQGFGLADFLAALRFAGITYQDSNAAISAAKTLCQLEDTGSSEDEIIGNLQQRNGFNGNGAAKFTVIAVGAYCPKYITGEGRGPKPEGAVGD